MDLEEKLKKEFRDEVTEVVVKHVRLLVSLAGKYNQVLDIIEGNAPYQVVSDVSEVSNKFIVTLIERLDDDFAAKERILYKEYKGIRLKYQKKLKLVEMLEQQELALAYIQNRVSLSVATVQEEAERLLPSAKKLGVGGKPLARLEYLSELTLQKEIQTFDGILKDFPDYI